MSVWDDVIGQEATVATLQQAVVDPEAMTHTWLFTGPPGSGRSNAARAFAAALECEHRDAPGCGRCRECRTVLEGSHADVTLLATEGLSIKVEQARDLALLAGHRPSVGPWRVILIEDADRLTDKAADALLKALEEPPTRTVWLLCAPSLEDVIITIRSRSRHVRLRTPPVAAVADLLVRRDGIDRSLASYAARAAQSHVGMARRLARDDSARNRRREVVQIPTTLGSLGDALQQAENLHAIATEETGASSGERNVAERTRLMELLGADPAARTQPPYIRSQLKTLEREQQDRAKRMVRDVLDRSLTDLLSVYRDALLLHSGAQVELVNESEIEQVRTLARTLGPDRLLLAMDAIGLARERIIANAAHLLTLEAMMVSLQLRPTSRKGVDR